MSKRNNPGALVGEKSQSVYSANGKLDAMLVKELKMLDTSKHRVAHRITLNQRVVNMNFQKKIHRSKIFHARMTDNKKMLGDLMKHDNFNFQTGGNSEESLIPQARSKSATNSDERRTKSAKIKVRPSASKTTTRHRIRPAATTVTTASNTPAPSTLVKPDSDIIEDLTSVTFKDVTAGEDSVVEGKRPGAPTEQVQSEDKQNAIGDGDGHGPSHGRTEGDHDDEDSVPSLKSPSSVSINIPALKHRRSTLSASVRRVDSNSITHADHKTNRPKTAMATLRATTPDVKAIARPKSALRPEIKDKIQAESIDTSTNTDDKTPANTDGKIPTNSDDKIPTNSDDKPRSPGQIKRKQSASPKHGMPSIFGEEKRPTIFELNEDRLRRAKYPDRVKDFVSSLTDVVTEQPTDYYAARLAEKSTTRRQPPPRPSSAEIRYENNEIKRSVGNLKAANMTFRTIKPRPT